LLRKTDSLNRWESLFFRLTEVESLKKTLNVGDKYDLYFIQGKVGVESRQKCNMHGTDNIFTVRQPAFGFGG
jgi:hypothetical protein